MIQSQPKLCDFVSLSDTYIQVVHNAPKTRRIRKLKKNEQPKYNTGVFRNNVSCDSNYVCSWSHNWHNL